MMRNRTHVVDAERAALVIGRQLLTIAVLGVAVMPALAAERTWASGDIHPPSLPCGYEVEVIEGPWNPDYTPIVYVQAIGEDGSVIGYYSWSTTYDRGFYRSPDGDFTTIEAPEPYNNIYPLDINEHKEIVGTVSVSSGIWHGFHYDLNTEEWTILYPADPNGVGSCWVRSINDEGVVVGRRSLEHSQQPYNAYIWTAEEGFTDLGVLHGQNSGAGDINNSNKVIGWMGQSSLYGIGFTYQDGRFSEFPQIDGYATIPVSINESGEVCGGYREIVDNDILWRKGFVQYSDGSISTIEPLPGFDGTSSGWINDDGYVTGFFTIDDVNDWYGFVWHDGHALLLNDLAINADIHAPRPRDINNAGQIVVRGKADGVSNEGLILNPVESPLGDLTGDCEVGGKDLGLLLNEWGKSESLADLNDDGIVDSDDLAILLSAWTK